MLTVLLLSMIVPAFSQQSPIHYVCIQSAGVFHDKEHCASLAMCTGAKIRKTKKVDGLKPCPKCARPVYSADGFANIKNILGVKDRKQVIDSLGTPESSIRRPGGYTIRISGPPQSSTINTIEYFFDQSMTFGESHLVSKDFYKLLGLNFAGCRADTIRNSTPHPVSGAVRKDFTIEYRGCSIVEKRDQYEDVSKYFYQLNFISKESDRGSEVEKIQLLMKADK